jgi:UDP:flavonoid glycosyltransferase YjiC (YdhE family)
VVHQAGIGTLAQALRAGRPQVILPVAFDQPDNARRAAALGVGRVLPFEKVTVIDLYWGLNDPVWESGEEAQLLDPSGNVRAVYTVP